VTKFIYVLAALAPLTMAAIAAAQPPGGGRDRQGPPGQQQGQAGDLVARMMAFGKNKDGKLTRDEITDRRLLRLFDQADTNKDGVVTKEELEALAKKLADDDRGGPVGPGGGPGGRRGRGQGGPGGQGGQGGPGSRMGGPPQPGQILPPFMQESLKMTDEQKKQLDVLQNEVNAKLDKILTDEQKKQMREMPDRGPGGPGGPGGFGPPGGGPGGPGGGPGGRPGGPGGQDR
jgi:hypothetical protein